MRLRFIAINFCWNHYKVELSSFRRRIILRTNCTVSRTRNEDRVKRTWFSIFNDFWKTCITFAEKRVSIIQLTGIRVTHRGMENSSLQQKRFGQWAIVNITFFGDIHDYGKITFSKIIFLQDNVKPHGLCSTEQLLSRGWPLSAVKVRGLWLHISTYDVTQKTPMFALAVVFATVWPPTILLVLWALTACLMRNLEGCTYFGTRAAQVDVCLLCRERWVSKFFVLKYYRQSNMSKMRFSTQHEELTRNNSRENRATDWKFYFRKLSDGLEILFSS